MNKRQRKKYAKKRASNLCLALIESTRKILRRDAPVPDAAFNYAWRELQKRLKHCQDSEVYRIERRPVWIGPYQPSDDFSKASGTHAAAGKQGKL